MSSATYTSFDVIVVITHAVWINRKMENFKMFRKIIFVIYNFITSLLLYSLMSSKKFPL